MKHKKWKPSQRKLTKSDAQTRCQIVFALSTDEQPNWTSYEGILDTGCDWGMVLPLSKLKSLGVNIDAPMGWISSSVPNGNKVRMPYFFVNLRIQTTRNGPLVLQQVEVMGSQGTEVLVGNGVCAYLDFRMKGGALIYIDANHEFDKLEAVQGQIKKIRRK